MFTDALYARMRSKVDAVICGREREEVISYYILHFCVIIRDLLIQLVIAILSSLEIWSLCEKEK